VTAKGTVLRALLLKKAPIVSNNSPEFSTQHQRKWVCIVQSASYQGVIIGRHRALMQVWSDKYEILHFAPEYAWCRLLYWPKERTNASVV
jgi:hypothetical protein